MDALETPWRIKLFGWLRADRGDQSIHRFPTQKAASLLARLAYFHERPHPREALMEMLWPDADPDAARNRFRVTLSALRRVLEPPGVPSGSVLIADRTSVCLGPSVRTDVREFNDLLAEASRAGDPIERCHLLELAAGLYGAELLPGFYDAWIEPERARLAALYVDALSRIAGCMEERENLAGAIEAMRRAVTADTLHEESHQRLIGLLLTAEQPAAALRQYRDMKRRLRDGLGRSPSAASEALLGTIRRQLRLVPAPAPAPAAASFPEPAPSALNRTAPTAPPAHLPVPLTRFIGREEEVARLCGLLQEGSTRLVTLTGPGGSGKTRLALEAATRMTPDYGRSVWFVPLAELTDPGLVVDAVFQALRLRRLPTVDPMTQLTEALGNRPSLLVLDNFEQLVDGGAMVVGDLLRNAPSLTCAVTSQVRLQVEGEQEFPVPPLSTPPRALPLETMLAYPSVRLFVDRAQAVLPDFRLSDHNAGAVAALCHRLEGIPLAIELAAAWSHMLTPAQMVDRLSDRFDLLVTRRRDRLDRHRTLRATLDWSYGLLPGDLQRFFARLSVFRGGCTLEAAAVVCGEPESTTMAYLADLRERSFLVSRESGPEMRFSMLETLREYASSLMSEDEQRDLVRRHMDYYLDLAERSYAYRSGPELSTWMDFLERHIDNLRAALDAGLAPGGDADKALRLSAALMWLWEHRGHLQEGRRYLAAALEAAPGAEPAHRLHALNAAGRLAVCQGAESEGTPLAREALDLARSLGDRHGEAFALRNAAFASYIRADFARAAALEEESLALFRELDDAWGVAALLDDLGSVVCRMGQYHRARRLLEESLAVNRRLGHPEGIASALFGLGVIARDLGEWEAARELLEESLAYGQDLGETLLIALCRSILGTVFALQGDPDTGRSLIESSLDLFRDLRDRRGEMFSLYHLGMLVFRSPEPRRSDGLLRESLRLSMELGDRRYVLYNVDGLALLAAETEDAEEAARLFGWSEEYAREIGHPWPPYRVPERIGAIAAVRTSLGENRFSTLWEEGRTLPVEAVVEEWV